MSLRDIITCRCRSSFASIFLTTARIHHKEVLQPPRAPRQRQNRWHRSRRSLSSAHIPRCHRSPLRDMLPCRQYRWRARKVGRAPPQGRCRVSSRRQNRRHSRVFWSHCHLQKTRPGCRCRHRSRVDTNPLHPPLQYTATDCMVYHQSNTDVRSTNRMLLESRRGILRK